MNRTIRWSVASVSLLALLTLGMPPSFADHNTRGPGNVENIEWVADVANPHDPGTSADDPINSDMAFWGDLLFQGNFQGFRIIDISDPANPSVVVDYEGCNGGQGDLIVWEDLLVRSWDAPAGDTGATCGGAPVKAGFEGLHLFDVSNPATPTLIDSIPMVGGILTIEGGTPSFFGAAAQFGPALDATGVTSDLELVNDGVVGSGTPPGTVNDGCETPFVNDVEGKIALIDRGFCGFNVKVKNAQIEGAVGVIVMNNVAGGAGNMAGIDPTITIPSIHVSQASGTALKALPPDTGATLAADPDSGIPGCGSHTATGVPDPDSGLLRVYNGGSNAICNGMDLVEIPLTAPANAEWYGRAVADPAGSELGRSCHDITVYLVDKLRAVCSGSWTDADPEPDVTRHGFAYFSMDSGGGTIDQPAVLYQQDVPNTATIGHTSAFSWDGTVLVWSHEPGGGTQAQCEITDPIEFRQMYFFRAETGNELGRWTIPSQSSTENCASVHIMQSIPTTNGRDVLSSGTYQAGTYVIDYTNPIGSASTTLGYSDPPPRVPTNLLAGAWTTYWYNGFLYESDILYGLHIMRSTSPEAQTRVKLPHLNAQTMVPFPTPPALCQGQEATHSGTPGNDNIVGTPGDDVIASLGGADVITSRGGNDTVCAGGGNDQASGGDGNDVLLGQDGNDALAGGAGNDLCSGGPGRDTATNCERRFSIP